MIWKIILRIINSLYWLLKNKCFFQKKGMPLLCWVLPLVLFIVTRRWNFQTNPGVYCTWRGMWPAIPVSNKHVPHLLFGFSLISCLGHSTSVRTWECEMPQARWHASAEKLVHGSRSLCTQKGHMPHQNVAATSPKLDE